MSTFSNILPQQSKKPIPTKHVNFTQGMILGVDEFVQEFAYQSNRDQWMTRDLQGYGTVSGLKVATREVTDENDIKIKATWVDVSAGTAASPRGLMIRVPRGQCANLSDWLVKEEYRAEIKRRFGSLSGKFPLYVVLSYRDCPTDDVPIPGEPCRNEADLTAPSRLTDDFVLELSLDPPAQCEEDALRKYVQWLAGHVQLTDSATGAGPDIATFQQAIRDAVQVGSPPCPVLDFTITSPPTMFTIKAAKACEYLRAAFLLWVTEFRPLWKADFNEAGPGCGETAFPSEAGKAPVEDKVLLAKLDVPLTDGEVSGAVTVIEDNRPYLLHSRMLQEWMLCRGGTQE